MSYPSPLVPSRTGIAAIVFDLDGTLIDSAPDIGAALNVLMAEHGHAPFAPAEIRAMIGDGSTELVRRAFADKGDPLPAERLAETVERYIDIYAAHPASTDCLYPGVLETLDALAAAGVALGLCTNKPQRVLDGLLPALDLFRRFEAVCGGDTLAVRKPDPAPLLWVLKRMGQPIAGSLMVGDGQNDVLSARAAGMPVVLVTYGYARRPARELGADLVIDHFADLLGAWSGGSV